MAAGSLTLGGNLSVAVGPLGRNAEGSGALSTKGKVAAMYSYSKTKGLFGGVSVEGSIILERQDANRLAYGGNPSSKQILSGSFDAPDWAGDLVSAIERYTGLPGGQRWQNYDEDGEGGGMGHGVYSPGGGEPSGYVFGGETGGQGSPNAKEADKGRRRGASVGVNDRPPSAARRLSAMNPFGSGNSSPKKGIAAVGMSSSENYNAGLTWDSDGPMASYGNRSRSGSSALRPGIDLETRVRSNSDPRARRVPRDGLVSSDDDGLRNGGEDLTGTWGSQSEDKSLSNSFARLRKDSIGSNGNGGRSRSNSKPPLPSLEENEYIPYETESKFAVRFGKNGSARNSPLRIHDDIDPFGGESSTSGRAFEAYQQPLPSHSSPSRTSAAYASSPNRRVSSPQTPPISRSKSGPLSTYARAVALFDLPAGQDGDLALKKGGVIFAMDKLGGGEWWRGMNAKGEVGIFPANYVEVVEIPKEIKGGLSRGDLKKRVLMAEFD